MLIITPSKITSEVYTISQPADRKNKEWSFKHKNIKLRVQQSCSMSWYRGSVLSHTASFTISYSIEQSAVLDWDEISMKTFRHLAPNQI